MDIKTGQVMAATELPLVNANNNISNDASSPIGPESHSVTRSKSTIIKFNIDGLIGSDVYGSNNNQTSDNKRWCQSLNSESNHNLYYHNNEASTEKRPRRSNDSFEIQKANEDKIDNNDRKVIDNKRDKSIKNNSDNDIDDEEAEEEDEEYEDQRTEISVNDETDNIDDEKRRASLENILSEEETNATHAHHRQYYHHDHNHSKLNDDNLVQRETSTLNHEDNKYGFIVKNNTNASAAAAANLLANQFIQNAALGKLFGK